MIESRCGLCCNTCSYREPCQCGGCIETQGHPFHGECPVALCVQKRGIDHCGQCEGFPCVLLMEYSCDPEHGDKPIGERIRKCREWQKESAPAGFRFGGVNFYSPEPEKLLEYYKKLGLRVMEDAAPGDEYFGASLALMGCDTPLMWIWRCPQGNQSKNNLCFTTGGKLAEVYQTIRKAGVECDPPFRAPWGGMELLLTDPDGNTILFL